MTKLQKATNDRYVRKGHVALREGGYGVLLKSGLWADRIQAADWLASHGYDDAARLERELASTLRKKAEGKPESFRMFWLRFRQKEARRVVRYDFAASAVRSCRDGKGWLCDPHFMLRVADEDRKLVAAGSPDPVAGRRVMDDATAGQIARQFKNQLPEPTHRPEMTRDPVLIDYYDDRLDARFVLPDATVVVEYRVWKFLRTYHDNAGFYASADPDGRRKMVGMMVNGEVHAVVAQTQAD